MFLLFKLARPRLFVELGVYLGASFITACEAASRYATGTRCVGVDTFQGDEHAGQINADDVFRELTRFLAPRYPHGELVRSTFDDALARIDDGSVDLLHIDGLHTYEAVRHDFEAWQPKLSDRSIVLFHDTAVRERDFGVWRLWAEVARRYPHVEFRHSFGLGVLVTGPDRPAEVDRLLAYTGDDARADLFRTLCEAAGASLPARMSAPDRAVPRAPGMPPLATVAATIGRNQPCPCGSGVRYKHCHGKLV